MTATSKAENYPKNGGKLEAKLKEFQEVVKVMCGGPNLPISHISCFYKTVNELQMSPRVTWASPKLMFPVCAFLLQQRPDKMAVRVTWLNSHFSWVKNKVFQKMTGVKCLRRPWLLIGAAGSMQVDSVPGGFQQCLTGACGYTERQASPNLQSAEPVIV